MAGGIFFIPCEKPVVERLCEAVPGDLRLGAGVVLAQDLRKISC